MKKITAILSSMLMLGAINVFACPTVAECNAVSDGYGRYQCLQSVSTCQTALPVCPPPVMICHEEAYNACAGETNAYSLAMCMAFAPKTRTVCAEGPSFGPACSRP